MKRQGLRDHCPRVAQRGFNTYLPDPSPASSPCQVLAEALKKYADGNTETKVSCLNMLKKQDESRQQLHVAFMDFFRHENVCHDQAKQTISDLFDGYGATEAISDVLSAQRPPFFGNPPVVSICSVPDGLMLTKYLFSLDPCSSE